MAGGRPQVFRPSVKRAFRCCKRAIVPSCHCIIRFLDFEMMTEVSINKDMRLSEHFTLGELTKTSFKTEDGNIPSRVAIENLRNLCENWLEDLRYSYNRLYHKSYATILLDLSDESQEDFDELLLERSPKGGYWLHFAVRPSGNRRKIRLIQT